jgi:hypothetical protein
VQAIEWLGHSRNGYALRSKLAKHFARHEMDRVDSLVNNVEPNHLETNKIPFDS